MSNYPAGLEDWTPNTPWNVPEIPEKDFDITVCQCLSKTVTVTTNNYIPEFVDRKTGEVDVLDTSDTPWSDVYADNDYHTPNQLIALFKKYLEGELNGETTVSKAPSYLKALIKECEDWCVDEEDFLKN